MKENLYIIKIGGNCIDDKSVLLPFLKKFSALKGHKILIHGGGNIATDLAKRLNIEQTFYHGRRITDRSTLDIAVMSYRGLINSELVSTLQSLHCNAIGLSGTDAGLIKAHRRPITSIDYGYVGDIDAINTDIIQLLLENNLIPVIAPITTDEYGTLLNTNADTIATTTAIAMQDYYEVSLLFCFDKKGVFADADNQEVILNTLCESDYEKLRNNDTISNGMNPKLENAFHALNEGVSSIIIMHPDALEPNTENIIGTRIVK